MSLIQKTDPELIQQLENARANDSFVEAVVRFRPDDPKQVVPTPERTEELTKKLLARVKKQVGKSAARYNIFKNLGSFAVSAEPGFLRELMSQPEVAAVVANRQPQDALIAPVKKSPVQAARNQKPRSTRKFKVSSTAARSGKKHKSG